MTKTCDNILIITEALRMKFEAAADENYAKGMKAYMRNISDFYGVTSPRRKEILSQIKAETGFPVAGLMDEFVKYAWMQPQREWQYAAMEMMAPSAGKGDTALLTTAEYMITVKSWWDTVDYIASNIVGQLLKKNKGEITAVIEKWLKTDNHWLWRTALLFQLKYGSNTDEKLLFGLCEQLASEQDFFIRKGIGWALRQYSKYNPEAVTVFVNTHTLSALSRKEALKVIERAKTF